MSGEFYYPFKPHTDEVSTELNRTALEEFLNSRQWFEMSVSDMYDVNVGSGETSGTQTTKIYTTDAWDGLFDWLGKNKGAESWAHPETSRGLVTTSASSTASGSSSNMLSQGGGSSFGSNNSAGSWLKFDFGEGYEILMSYWGLYGISGLHNLLTWDIEGSNDDGTYDVIDSWSSGQLPEPGWRSRAVAPGTWYRYIRVRSTGIDTNGQHYLHAADFEVWGSYRAAGAGTASDGDLFQWDSSANEWVGVQFDTLGPLSVKGDIYTYGTQATRLPVGADGEYLTASSGEATGLLWAALDLSSKVDVVGDTMTGLLKIELDSGSDAQLELEGGITGAWWSGKVAFTSNDDAGEWYIGIRGDSDTGEEGNLRIEHYSGSVWTGWMNFDISVPEIVALHPLNMDSNLISGVTDPVSAQDAATKTWVETQIAAEDHTGGGGGGGTATVSRAPTLALGGM